MPHAKLLPPGPRSPAFWQLLRYSHAPLTFLEDCAARFGSPFTIRLSGYGSFVFLTESDAIRDVFRGDPHALHSGEANDFLSVTVGPNSVLVLDEEAHARQRRLVVPPLKGERMRAFLHAMRVTTHTEAASWPRGRPVKMLPAMRRITLRVILQAVLGLPLGPELTEIETKVERLLAYTRPNRYSIAILPFVPVKLFAGSRWLPFFRQLGQLDAALYPLIAELHRSGKYQPGSVIAELFAAGEEATPTVLRDIIVTLLLAGFDTTSIALSWALEQILPRADIVARILEEMRSTDDPDQMTYLDAAIRESLRLRTAVPFVVRLTKQPFTVGGRTYPPGVMLAPCSHLVHRRPDLYPEPEAFKPERFLERKFAGHEWFPFGGGNRVCVGMAFALYEMKVVLAELLGSGLRLTSAARSRWVRQGLVLGPHDGVPVIVEDTP